MIEATTCGPEPLVWEGRHGLRYWMEHPFTFTGDRRVDTAVTGYPVAVFLPDGRPAAETPVVLALQGMAAPFQWNAFLVPTLLDMGIACVFFETPMAGERSLSRSNGNVLDEVVACEALGVPVTSKVILSLTECVTRDIGTVFRMLEDRHGLTDPRRALFGVSLGTLFTSHAFLRDGHGQRLLGTIGHADMPAFARSFAPAGTNLLAKLPRQVLGAAARLGVPKRVVAGLHFLKVLEELGRATPHLACANPMTFAHKAGDRRVRFLVGGADRLVRPADAHACAARFADGEAYVVPGMTHGGAGFVDHVRTFVGTQLGDWRW
jgi:hypothetical protein